jgi:hypothetical protein
LFILSSWGWEQVTKWLKATSEGDKCQVEGMQYILLALVYLGALLLHYPLFGKESMFLGSREQGGSYCMENLDITLSA